MHVVYIVSSGFSWFSQVNIDTTIYKNGYVHSYGQIQYFNVSRKEKKSLCVDFKVQIIKGKVRAIAFSRSPCLFKKSLPFQEVLAFSRGEGAT
jgi:hypothetical protein